MRHLKSYKSNRKFQNIIKNINDICQELKDQRFHIEVTHSDFLNQEPPYYIRIKISNYIKDNPNKSRFFTIDPILSDVQRLLDYMELNKFECSIRVEMNPITAKSSDLKVKTKLGVQYLDIPNNYINKDYINPKILGSKISELMISCITT